jgi:two-component system, OmpR family, response regulator
MESIRLLIVDDEKDFVKLFLKRFERRGFTASGVHSGHEALDYLSANEVDIVILDVKMPGMDGIETLKEVKKRCPLVEVIMLTGHGSVESGIQGMIHGAYDYVMKPFRIEDLIERINKAYERKLLQSKEKRAR